MNKSIIDFLQNEINEKKISHAFLVETNNCETLLEELTKVFVDNDLIPSQNIENNISVSVIRPENNLIDKNKILELQKFIITKSVINKYKIYYIINAELMNQSSFNKLLKVLEEPSDNTIGFLLTENENQIISTIKSRCKRFKKYYELAKIETDNFLLDRLKKYQDLSFYEISDLKKELLQKEKTEIIQIINEFKKNIIFENSVENISKLANLYKILDNIVDLIKSNVNLELCLDKMFIELRN